MSNKDLIAEARAAMDYRDDTGWFWVARLADALEAATRERDAALAAIERVRAEHPVGSTVLNNLICQTCGTPSPCPTVAALDGAPEAAAPAETEWEYGLLVEALGDTEPEPHPTRESAQHVIDHPEMYRKWTHDNPVTMRRRRPAGPWLPVPGGEGESDE